MMDIVRVQQRLLEMGKSISQILEGNNIPYIICFGTLLGAVRHNGFIPWDDDFDFILFDDTYEKALDVLTENLPKDVFLESERTEPLYFHAYAHVKDLNSCATCSHYPQDSIYQHNGISIDLYKAVKIRENELEEFLSKEKIAYLTRRFKIGNISNEEYEKKLKEVSHTKNELIKFKDDNYIYGMALPEKYMRIVDVFPLKRYQFEDTSFWGPNSFDALLSQFYGKYMELPAPEDRIPHYDSVSFLEENK